MQYLDEFLNEESGFEYKEEGFDMEEEFQFKNRNPTD